MSTPNYPPDASSDGAVGEDTSGPNLKFQVGQTSLPCAPWPVASGELRIASYH